MKKKLLSALLCLVLALTLLPTAALAAPTRLKSVDLVIDLPKAGDPNEMETEVTIKSMKSGNIDLLANGAGILYTEWQGDNVETETLCLLSMESVPEDASVVMINAPTSDLCADEAEMLVQYVENGCVYFTEVGIQEYIAKCTHRAKPMERAATYRKPRSFRR